MNIDEAAGLMDLDLTLTLYWRDDKLSINDTSTNKEKITINPEQDDLLKKIWCPDIAIDQALQCLPCQHKLVTFMENPCRRRV